MGVPVALAIVVGLLSSFVQSLGLTIQRKSHVQDSSLPVPQQRSPHRRPLWLLGFGIYITSNIFSTIFQLDALPIVILAPLGAVSLIYNALLARLLLGDYFGSRTAVGTLMVALGAVGIAVFGVVQEEEHTLEEILRLWKRPAFVAFFSVVTAAVVVVLLGAHISSWHISRQLRPIALPTSPSGHLTPPPSAPISNYASPCSPPPIPFRPSRLRRWSSPSSPLRHPSLSLPPTAGIEVDKNPSSRVVHFAPSSPSPQSCFPLTFPCPGPEPSPSQQKALTLTGLGFAAASGVLSGMSLVLAKAAVELLVITLDHLRTGKGENQFSHVQSWFLVAGLVVGAVLQLVYLNYSLTFASPALVCPLAFCFFNLSSIFDGLVFYDQFGRLAPHQIALVSLGVALLLLGVWVVSAVQPTGDGGVDVGTWVEEDEAIRMEAEESPLLGRDHTEEPLSYEYDLEREGEPEQIHGYEYEHGQEPPSSASTLAAEGYPQPRHRHLPPGISAASVPTSPAIPSPISPTGLWSPTTPVSPGAGMHSPTSRRRRPRYGTLLPDFAPVGAPTGFAIGLGAASPGFVLRPGSFSVPPGKRVRSRSEGTGGIEAVIRGDGVGVVVGGGSAGSPPVGLGVRAMRRSESDSAHGGLEGDDHAVIEEEGLGGAQQEGENEVERQLRGWRWTQPRRSIWDRFWNRDRGVRLPEDPEGQ